MTPERWRTITDVFHAALARAPGDRAAFVADACAQDDSLRRDVEVLLRAHEQAGSFGDGALAPAPPQLPPGTQLGPYRIDALLGAGGMGQVYRATDTRLNRIVAVKILSPLLQASLDIEARFDREAQTISKLTHPHICRLYDVGRQDGIAFLVMEHLDGETLAERLARGPLPIDQALRVAIEIAGALTHAHRHGIVHRDLKPGNVMLTDTGAKLLDFGLAKIRMAGLSTASAATAKPTDSAAGMLIGTLQYMSPEQLEGREADVRSDIWALGCVLYELFAGRKPFEGTSQATLIAAILERPVQHLRDVQPLTPPALDRVVETCLAKNPDDRWQSARDVRRELEWISQDVHAAPAHHSVNPNPRRITGAWRGVLAAGVVAAIAVIGTLAWIAGHRERPAPIFASIDAPLDSVLGESDRFLPTRTPMLFSLDGRSLIIQAARLGKLQLYLRSLDRPDARPIAGTEGARLPFLSPDGRWIGFWTAVLRQDGELRKVPIDGGTPTTICKLGSTLGPFGATWGRGDIIVFSEDGSQRLMRVSANGGTPVPLPHGAEPTKRAAVAPVFLPDGQRVLFTDLSPYDATDARLMVQSIDKDDARLVLADAADARLLPSGDLAFMRLGTLMTAGFDAARAETRGQPLAAMNEVMQSGLRAMMGGNITNAGMFAVSPTGSLAVIRGQLTGPLEGGKLIWATPDGQVSPAEPSVGRPSGSYDQVRISRDGSRALVSVGTAKGRQWWVIDWARNLWMPCGDCPSTGAAAAWSADGSRILLSGNGMILMHPLDGIEANQVLVREPDHHLYPTDWLEDGRIVYISYGRDRIQIKLLEPGSSTGQVIVADAGVDPHVSPDGRFLAYTHLDDDGARHIMVQTFPKPGDRILVSQRGAVSPVWSRHGQTLHYLGGPQYAPDLVGFTVDIVAASRLQSGAPRESIRVAGQIGQGCHPVRCIDMAPDGRLLLLDKTLLTHPTVTRMDLVLNWTATLPKRR